MRSVVGAIARVLFWRYSRGSWQYDILCLVIILFIFLTPRPLFDSRLAEPTADSQTERTPEVESSPADPKDASEADDVSAEARDAS